MNDQKQRHVTLTSHVNAQVQRHVTVKIDPERLATSDLELKQYYKKIDAKNQL